MANFVFESLKKAPSLIPLFFVVGCGLVGATFYPIRCALKNPEVTWNRKKNPEPWNEYKNKQYKFYQSDRVPKTSSIPEY